MRRGAGVPRPCGEVARGPSCVGGVPAGASWPGNGSGVPTVGLAPSCEAGPATESGDSVVPMLTLRLDEGVLCGTVGLSIEWTPRSLNGPDLQSSPGVDACVRTD